MKNVVFAFIGLSSRLKSYKEVFLPDDSNLVVIVIKPYRIEYMKAGSMEPVVWKA